MKVCWDGQELSRLCLGTAQLGQKYGIANTAGRPDQGRANEIVAAAWQCGISLFDTAQAYGESELVLGMALEKNGISKQAKLVTKISPRLEHSSTAEIVESVRESAERLGVPKMFSVLLHRASWLGQYELYREAILSLLQKEVAECVGVSVYSPGEFDQAIAKAELRAIQLPYNLLDQRARVSNCFEKGTKSGKRIFVRSVFLQGLLLMDPAVMPDSMCFAREFLQVVRKACASQGLGVREAALGFGLAGSNDAVVVIGAETPEQIVSNIEAIRKLAERKIDWSAFFPIADGVPERVIDPSKWNIG